MAQRILAAAPNVTYKASISANNRMLQFRHPWVMEGKYGIVRSVGIARLSDTERTELTAQANRLLQAAPKLKRQVPPGTDKRLVSVYFDAFDDLLKPATTMDLDIVFPEIIDHTTGTKWTVNTRESEEPEISKTDDGRTKVTFQLNFELVAFLTAVNEHFKNIERTHEAEKLLLQRQIEEQQATISEMEWRLAEQSKRQRSTTMQECWRHFRRHFKLRSTGDARHFLMMRVKKILQKIGRHTTFSELTESKIEVAVLKTKPKTQGEEQKRRQAIKRFFRFVCRPQQADGMGFPVNPAAALYVGSPQKIARDRRNRGLIVDSDPRPLVADKRISAYWRAMFGVMGFAGLRLSEACALKWCDIDFENELIHVRANEVKDGKKTDASVRCLRPFKNVWPLLKELHDTDKRSDFLFYKEDRRLPPDKRVLETWFVIRRGTPRVESATGSIKSLLTSLGYDSAEPSQRLRRWWATTMKAQGFGEHESLLGGHSKQVSEDHYTVSERVARSLKMPTI